MHRWQPPKGQHIDDPKSPRLKAKECPYRDGTILHVVPFREPCLKSEKPVVQSRRFEKGEIEFSPRLGT